MHRLEADVDFEDGFSHASKLKSIVAWMVDGFPTHHTLLAVCPNSEAVARAALRAARDADAPMLLAATLNQVDRDGGYTGRTPRDLVQFVRNEARSIGLISPVFVCLDHGGPWLKDEHVSRHLSLEETMAEVKRSLQACVEAGYALLHIDPTVDITTPGEEPLASEIVVERTVELISHAEQHRARRGLEPVAYEVGTEEVEGGLADVDSVARFLSRLTSELRREDLEYAWPSFVVGRVGTNLGTSFFDEDTARRLAELAHSHDSLLKGHYSDFVHDPHRYPIAGVGGANVGPEFTSVEYQALQELLRLEKDVGGKSGLGAALHDAVVGSGRWKKWLREEERQVAFDQLPARRREWLLQTSSRYVWTDPRVVEARASLYENVSSWRNPDAYVIWRIQSAITNYLHAFNLLGFHRKMAAHRHP